VDGVYCDGAGTEEDLEGCGLEVLCVYCVVLDRYCKEELDVFRGTLKTSCERVNYGCVSGAG